MPRHLRPGKRILFSLQSETFNRMANEAMKSGRVEFRLMVNLVTRTVPVVQPENMMILRNNKLAFLSLKVVSPLKDEAPKRVRKYTSAILRNSDLQWERMKPRGSKEREIMPRD